MGIRFWIVEIFWFGSKEVEGSKVLLELVLMNSGLFFLEDI